MEFMDGVLGKISIKFKNKQLKNEWGESKFMAINALILN